MISRVSYLFALTTEPLDRERASPHSGGWSESHWKDGTIVSASAPLINLARCRAALLPKQASLIGYRIALYEILANKLVPKGTSTGRWLYPGDSGYHCDLPQVSLDLSGKAAGQPNQNRIVLRGIPDEMMQRGEWTPSVDYQRSLQAFQRILVNSSWGFIGRDLNEPSVRVTSVVNNILTTPVTGAFTTGDSVIFNRVKDDNGRPIRGSFLVTNDVGGTTFTLQGLANQPVSIANGTVRRDKIALMTYQAISPGRAVVRKIGRPFESYRGRQSNRT